jgi:hypothetical protein
MRSLYRRNEIEIQGSAYNIDVDVEIDYHEFLRILEEFSQELFQHYKSTVTPEQTKEDKKFSYEYSTTTDIQYATLDTSLSELSDAVSSLNDDDLQTVLQDSIPEWGSCKNASSKIITIPNLEAEREVELFLESYNKKWSL